MKINKWFYFLALLILAVEICYLVINNFSGKDCLVISLLTILYGASMAGSLKFVKQGEGE